METAALTKHRSVTWSCFKAIWMGRNGLRAGWAVLLFMVICVAVVVGVGHVAYVLHHPLQHRGELTPGRQIVLDTVLICAVLVATKVLSLIDRKSWLDYGLRAPHRAAHFAQGLFWGVVLVSGTMAALVLSGGAKIEFSGIDFHSLISAAALWAVVFLLVAIAEELTCRGYLFFKLATGTHPLVATILTSLLFGAAHLSNHGESIIGLIQATLFGLAACVAVWRTGSLWWVIGVHAAWDWSESFLFGTANSGGSIVGNHFLITRAIGPDWLSGGSTGPEGSLLMFPAMFLVALIALRTLPSRHQQTTG
ncbi:MULTISPECIES: CPBP family intramembrane glutamic endopeptidase [Paraburkholderia]|uniref:CPBP family intramembrane glutamic endopeptidase n=1 Tax=Paraburkholderia TaxID=1822464 RepID=UPI002250DE28|nr:MULTISPECIES: CPBP family intramembrane glutamic endopeptidase [Paraburkholderia]MCX4161328.1 CPBP family intramembrane metalloprotease [Paraburkholderia megapolitana]MDN7156824.1 CPBP family intramembrane metalloprotease [Paraburkholderia sp. CHISQ3]MDQ6493869.1 CPBP family intramembrane metalloprotease [Paraburkholderia megapolitana]